MNNTFRYHNNFVLESGKSIDDLRINYSTFGERNEDDSNIIWVFHAISGDTEVTEWWAELFGEGKLYNPNDYFIICANSIGSPYGSTRPEHLEFPIFTVRDVVSAHFLLAEHLGIDKINTAIGGSFGGYQALEFSYSFTGEIEYMILLASSARESAWGIAIHESQRLAMLSDDTFGAQNGGVAGLKAARSIAMLTYRTADTFVETQSDLDEKIDHFKASSYIQYHGDKFTERFDAISYYYLTKCIDSHHIGRKRGGESTALNRIKIPALVIGFTTDTLVPIRNQKFMAEEIPNAQYHEIHSEYGHDGFLKEGEKITKAIQAFYQKHKANNNQQDFVVMKFGGSSLYGEQQLENVNKIVKADRIESPVAIVVSARGNTTDLLLALYELARDGKDWSSEWKAFVDYQTDIDFAIDIQSELDELQSVLKAISILRDDSFYGHDRVVAFGELISAKVVSSYFTSNGLKSRPVDARNLIFTHRVLDEFDVDLDKSRRNTKAAFDDIDQDTIPIITGYIASSEEGKTVTLGRNGSNYSASLIASFIGAKEVQNWTDVDGVYSANPRHVPNAIRLDSLTYKEANEMANFGMKLLHPKTIQPLIHAKIPMVIKSTLHPEDPGTRIEDVSKNKGIKAVTTIDNVSLITIEGDDLLDKVGIDARIFTALHQHKISVKMIAQASSERGIGFVINDSDVQQTEIILQEEFKEEIQKKHISHIGINREIGIVAILGRHNFALEKAIKSLRRNKIWMYLISNSISGEHISLVVDRSKLDRAETLVHNEVYGVIKTIHVFAIGKGQVGGEMIDQIVKTSGELTEQRNMKIVVIGVADTQRYIFNSSGIDENWREKLSKGQTYEDFDSITKELKNSNLENIVLADNTSSGELAERYDDLLKQNFDIVASNKKSNSSSLEQYRKIRKTLQRRNRFFYYETNVGAGLPIMDTLKHLYESSDTITKIRGVFSGSLGYIFNNYSVTDVDFVDLLIEARDSGYAEPDPREDLSGLDVARKLVILAREINFPAELEKVEVENLIPSFAREEESFDKFLGYSDKINAHYLHRKQECKEHEVLRYVGELDVKTSKLKVSLVSVDINSPLGQIKNADSLFEIYTESYGEQPIVVQGAGAGAKVTARGVYSDILRIGRQL